jgi:predicted PurR-regulated permease PerM
MAPLMFASSALLAETSALLAQVAAADRRGIAAPAWLGQVPMIGHWLEGRWQNELAYPGALQAWTQRTDAVALLGWAEFLGQFMARHAFIVLFTVLLLFVLYTEGQALADGLRRVLRKAVGERAEAYVDLATRAVRASVNSMLVVALFDGLATALVYTLVGVPHAGIWAAITGLLALVPFLGYVAVLALGVQLAVTNAATAPLVALGLGTLVLFCGDKVVRPLVSRHGLRLRFVWILMGCLGGFEALGLVGLVVGPVVLTLARELWAQRVRDVTPAVEDSR